MLARLRFALFRSLWLASFCASTWSCSPCQTRGSGEAERYEEGHVLPSGTVYETGGPSEPLLPFGPGQIYEVVHGLGREPTAYQGYVSFAPQLTPDGNPLDPDHPNNLAETAGNQLVVERWDDEIVRVRNDTCGQFYLRLVIWVDPAPAGLGGAASE